MLFGLRKPYFLGIDFGTSSIKAVELTVEGGKPKLVNFGEVALAPLGKGNTSPDHSYNEEIVLYLRALIKRFNPKSGSVSVAMPAFIGLISLIEFPEMNEEELQEAIQFEAHKYIPSSLEDVTLSWEVVGVRPGEDEKSGGKMEILLVAALKKEVARYQGYVEDAQLKMGYLELETFSLTRALTGEQPGLFLIIDIGARATNLVLVENGIVKMSRNLDAGGREITHILSEGLSITAERAEVLKKSGKDFLNLPESALIFPALQLISGEAERMLTAYHVKYPEKECNGVILSGGTGQLTGLAQYYAKIFNLPVTVGNPWQRIQYEESAENAIKKLGGSFSVAIGLALAGVENVTKKKVSLFKKSSLKAFLHKKI